MEGTNLLGKSHKQYVQDQIKVRQEKLGKTTKDNNDISWMNSKTSWVRLASSVNIENSTIRIPFTAKELYEGANYKAGGDTTGHQNVSPDINTIIKINLDTLNEEANLGTDVEIPTGKQRLELLDLDESFMGSTLAKKMVLVGGTEIVNFSENDGNIIAKKNKRKGISNKLQNSASSNFAYSSKNGDFGLVAMPGIQSADIKSKSMGSLREANISIRVNDAEQLELIETLYLRLGYSMFLEWGNSSYFKNNGEYIKGVLSEPGLIYDFLLHETPTQQEIDRVLKNKMADLNGDGVEETLTLEELASFEAQIDSIQTFNAKIEEERKRSCGNYDALFGKVTNFSWEFDPSGFYNVSLTMISWGDIIESLNINAFYPDVIIDFDDEGNPDRGVIDRKNSSALEAFIHQSTLPNSDQQVSSFVVFSIERTSISPIKNTIKSEINSDISIFGINLNTSEIESEESEYSALLGYDRGATNSKGKVISCNAQFGDTGKYFYLRFGDLLDFIKSKLLLYNGNSPIIDIDTRPNKNFCYNPKVNISADPSKVMIRRKLPYDPFATLPEDVLEVISGIDYETREGIFDSTFTVDKESIDTRIEEFDIKVPGTDIIGGNIMNIYFEKEYLYSIIDKLIDAKSGKLSLYNFIKELLNTANDCLGGVNKLDLRVIDDRVIQIYDQTPLYGVKLGESNEDSQQFNIYGLQKNNGSFVTNFGLKTELTNEFATTVAIGAQAQGNVVGEDSTMLSKWNFGLIDRFIPKKIDSISRDSKAKEKELEELKSLAIKIKELWNAYQIQYFGDYDSSIGTQIKKYKFPVMDTEQFGSYTKLQRNFFKSLIKIETNSHSSNPNRLSNQMGMLPINLNLEMDGLSGVRIYDQINVDTRFLPSYYPNYLVFIIKGVSHTFAGNRWITKIDTIAQPKVQFQEDLKFFDKFNTVSQTLIKDTNTTSNPPHPNAERLRLVLDELGYTEKGQEISEAGDITAQITDAAIAVFRVINNELPTLSIKVTSGNDAEHAAITDYTSFHTIGDSIDFIINPATPENQKTVVQILKEFAADPLNNFGYIDEYSNPTKQATGYHYHLVIGGGRLATQNRNDAIALSTAGEITPRNILDVNLLELAKQQRNDANL